MRGYRGRRDARHGEIRKALKRCGWSVEDTADAGNGFPDLVAGIHGVTYLLEIKSRRGNKLNEESDEQTEKRTSWRGGAWLVIESAQDALAAEERRMRQSR